MKPCDDMYHLNVECLEDQTLHSFPLLWGNNSTVQSSLLCHLTQGEQCGQISSHQGFHLVICSQPK